MSLKNQLIFITCLYLMVFLYIRSFLSGIKTYQLCKTSYRKSKKSESFKEWLFYSRYKEEIPKILRMLYYFVLLIHPMCAIVCIVLHIIESQIGEAFTLQLAEAFTIELRRAFALGLAAFDGLWVLVIQLLFWSSGPDLAYERWINRKRGQKRDKK